MYIMKSDLMREKQKLNKQQDCFLLYSAVCCEIEAISLTGLNTFGNKFNCKMKEQGNHLVQKDNGLHKMKNRVDR